MKRQLNVRDFFKKEELLDFVNTNAAKLDILTITTSQEAFFLQTLFMVL